MLKRVCLAALAFPGLPAIAPWSPLTGDEDQCRKSSHSLTSATPDVLASTRRLIATSTALVVDAVFDALRLHAT